jgi:hypothetical protein
MKKSLTILYALLAVVCLPSLYYWLDGLKWDLSKLTAFKVFPLLGLLAFSVMWFHLMVAWYKRHHPEDFDYKRFFRETSNVVLALIILHPLILAVKSYSLDVKPLDFAGTGGRVFIVFGILAFFIFIIYEFVDRAREKPFIKNNWQYIVALNRAAMILIFYHALKLGTHLQNGPFKVIWWFFGLSLAAYFITSYKIEILDRNKK